MKKRMISIALILCLVLAVLPGMALASGDAVAQIGSTTYTSFAAAVAAAASGETITILPGVHDEPLLVDGKNLTIVGSTGAIIKTARIDPLNVLNSGETALGNNYCGLVTVKDATVTIKNLTILGDVDAASANGVLTHTARYAGVIALNANVTIENCQIKDILYTKNLMGMQNGVGVYAVANSAGSVTLTNTSIIGPNKGAVVTRANVTLSMDGCTIQGAGAQDITAQNGIQFAGDTTIKNTTVSGFMCLHPNAYKDAVALYDLSSNKSVSIENVTVSSCDFAYNMYYGTGVSEIKGGNYDGKLKAATGATLKISGGYFTLDPSAFLAADKVAVSSDKAGYNFMVAAKPPVEVVEGASHGTVSGAVVDVTTAGEISTAIGNGDLSTEGLTTAANDYAQTAPPTVDSTHFDELKQITNDAGLTEDAVTVVVQPYLDIAITGCDSNVTDGVVLSFEIEAFYDLVATPTSVIENNTPIEKDVNAVVLDTAVPMTVNTPVEVNLPIPDTLYTALNTARATTPLFVQHVKGSVSYYYPADLTGTSGAYFLTFTSEHGFSPFAILLDSRTATVTFKNEDDSVLETKIFTPTAVGTALPTLEKSGYVFSGWKFYSGGEEITVAGNASPYKTLSDGLLTALSGATGGDITAEPVFTPAGGTGDPEPKRPFTDVAENQWFYDAVYYCYDNKVMEGISATLFAPDSNLNRGMMVQILYNMENKPAVSGASTFTDVADNAWYADAVKWAASKGIVNGYGGGLYGPEDNVTREQMAKILNGYAAFKGYDVTASKDLTSFPDGNTVSEYALPMVRWAYATGLLTGRTNGLLDPQGNASRAEVATVMMRFIEKTAK